MILPDYWLTRPTMDIDEPKQNVFDQLLQQVISAGDNPLIDYKLPFPKWQFLCYAADSHGIAMHGTGDSEIDLFEPRQSNDLNDFGNQKAVYAAGDGLWAMFFAIVDRYRYPMSVTNACIHLYDADGHASGPFYVFSVSQNLLSQRPWRTGMVYLLPAETFITQPILKVGPFEVRIPQLASFTAVKPLARLEITPEDFPFLDHIRGHDDARLAEYANAMQTGGPWPE
jgi:hypothetical protein